MTGFRCGLEKCGCCFDLMAEPYRKLEACGHYICKECHDEQAEHYPDEVENDHNREADGTKRRKPTLCVLQNYEDWCNIDIIADNIDVVEQTCSESLTSVANEELAEAPRIPVDQGDGLRLEDCDLEGSVSEIKQNGSKHPMFGCRMCQTRVFKVDEDKAKNMPIFRNFGLVEDAMRSKQCETDEGHDSVSPDAEYWCMVCDKYICKECKQRYHRLMGTINEDSKDCRVISLAVKMGEKEIGPNLFLRQISEFTGCAQHSGVEQTHFCLRCKRLACGLCLLDSSTHAGHPVEELRLAVNDIKNKTNADTDKLTLLHNKIESKKRSIYMKKEDKLRQFEKMDSDVEVYAAELCAKIEKSKQNIRDEIEKERQRCLSEIEEYESELETAELEVWTFGASVRKILDVDVKDRDVLLNQNVVVQKHLSSNRELFDSLHVPAERASLKRILGESCEFQQNLEFLEGIVPETLGHTTRVNRETFLLHEHDLNQGQGETKRTQRAKGHKPSDDFVLKSPKIADLGRGRVALTDKAKNTVTLVRSSRDVMKYRDDVAFPINKLTGLANLGHGFIMLLREQSKLTLVTNSGRNIPLSKSCGPSGKYEICSLACVGETLYFACFDPNTSAGRGVICYQDFKYDFSASPDKSPFVFSLAMEYCRIGNALLPHCLAVRKSSIGLQLAVGQFPRSIIFISKKSSTFATLDGGDKFRVNDACFDRDGDVLVADGHHVLLYGIDGVAKGIVVGGKEGVKRPVAVGVTEENDLIVGDEIVGLRTFVYRKMALRQVEFRCQV
ncbi:uncharacterized protein LOC135489871 isoform X2 [Lineus longissimus]